MFFFQAEDGIRYLVRSRGLGDVYKRQAFEYTINTMGFFRYGTKYDLIKPEIVYPSTFDFNCLLYTSDAADERSSVDLGGRRIIKKQTKKKNTDCRLTS